MYLDESTILFSLIVVAAVAGFIGYERGRKAERENNEFWDRARGDFWRMAENLPDEDKAALMDSLKAKGEDKR